MTENEAKFLEKLDELASDLEVDMYSVANLNFFFEESANTIRKLIGEIHQYRAIGTIEEFKALKENQRKCEDCAGCTNWKCDCANERANAIDEFVKRLYKIGEHREFDWEDIYKLADQLKKEGTEHG